MWGSRKLTCLRAAENERREIEKRQITTNGEKRKKKKTKDRKERKSENERERTRETPRERRREKRE